MSNSEIKRYSVDRVGDEWEDNEGRYYLVSDIEPVLKENEELKNTTHLLADELAQANFKLDKARAALELCHRLGMSNETVGQIAVNLSRIASCAESALKEIE